MEVQSQFIEMFGNCQQVEKLSSLCDTFIDGDWIESKDQSDEGIRLVQTGNVGNGFFKGKEDKCRFISDETFDRLHCTEIFSGDILVSRLPDPIGRACMIPNGLGRMITAVDCCIIRLKESILADFFIAYTMTPNYSAQINEVTTGTTRRRVSRANLGNVKVPVPQIDKQKLFVSISEQADKSKFVGFKSQFIEMFKDCPIVKLEDNIKTQSGGTPNTKKQEYYNGGDIPWLSSGEVNQGYIFSTEKFITQAGLDNSSAKWVPKYSVLIAMYGATAGKVGFSMIPLTTNQAVCALLPCSSFNSLFLYYAVSQKTDWMISQCRGAAQPNISQGIIRSMEIAKPPMEQQKQFVSIAEQADKSKLTGHCLICVLNNGISKLIN